MCSLIVNCQMKPELTFSLRRVRRFYCCGQCASGELQEYRRYNEKKRHDIQDNLWSGFALEIKINVLVSHIEDTGKKCTKRSLVCGKDCQSKQGIY